MKKILSLVTVTFLLIGAFLVLPIAKANPGNALAASVWTTDSAGSLQNQFGPSEQVKIYWNPSPSGSTVDITVVDAADIAVAGPFLNQPAGNSPIVLASDLPFGYYLVKVEGQPGIIAAASIYFAPESQSSSKALSASVWMTDSVGNPQNQYTPGENVYIYWNRAPTDSTVDITVVDADNTVVAGPYTNQPLGNAPLSFTPPAPNFYVVMVNGQAFITIGVASFFVAPEVNVAPETPFGTIAAIFACFAAFATINITRAKNKKL